MRILFFLVILCSYSFAQPMNGIIKGKITDKNSKLPLPNSNIIVTNASAGITSDSSGRYSLSLPYGTYSIKFSYTGYQSKVLDILLDKKSSPIILNVELEDTAYIRKEITIVGKYGGTSVTIQELKSDDIKKMPTIYSDVLKTIHIMPGVTSNNELSSSYNVHGGNFDENLIYLNGYEIFRPFMLRSGVEETHNIINRDLVKDLRFFNSAFPAEFGDKMSSALEVNYQTVQDTGLHGILRGNFLYSGTALSYGSDKLNVAVAFRFAYPQSFLSKLQTAGKYNPQFSDIQLIAGYSLTDKSKLQLFIINATNKYDLTPEEWKGDFKRAKEGQSPLEIRSIPISEVTLHYSDDSYNIYSYNTSLAGLKFNHEFNNDTRLTLSSSLYYTEEKERTFTSGEIFIDPNAENTDYDEIEHLKSFLTRNNNHVEMKTYEFISRFKKRFNNNIITTGLSYRISNLDKSINEFASESGTESLLQFPITNVYSNKNKFTTAAFFIQDEISISNNLSANIGVRSFYYNYNKEFRVSPRLGVFYKPSENHSLSFNWGYYYQPPFFYELRNKDLSTAPILKSQKAVHYILAWEFQTKKKLKFLISPYYKKLDNLIPFYIEQLNIQYLDKNNMEGYAYGADFQVEGEFIKGMDSWVSYSYLDTRERLKEEGAKYNRRLLDQTHTIQVFLQDRFPSRPNWQCHLRMSFGSGFLFHQYVTEYDDSGRGLLKPSFNLRGVLPFYFRTDLGLTATFNILSGNEIIFTFELLNSFNNYNTLGYSFIQTFKDTKSPVYIKQILSKRFFNLGVELKF